MKDRRGIWGFEDDAMIMRPRITEPRFKDEEKVFVGVIRFHRSSQRDSGKDDGGIPTDHVRIDGWQAPLTSNDPRLRLKADAEHNIVLLANESAKVLASLLQHLHPFTYFAVTSNATPAPRSSAHRVQLQHRFL